MAICVYSVKEFHLMMALLNTQFVSYDFYDRSLSKVNLGAYNSSANFLFGISNATVNLFDNPYINVVAYEMTE